MCSIDKSIVLFRLPIQKVQPQLVTAPVHRGGSTHASEQNGRAGASSSNENNNTIPDELWKPMRVAAAEDALLR